MRGEFEFIRNIKEKYGLKFLGDDCAVLPKDEKGDLVITADLLVEDIDFRLSWTRAEMVGHKALAVSLSDIAAMGGTPKWAMLSIGLPVSVWRGKFLDKFYEGWFGLARQHGVELVGGDVSRTPDTIIIDSIVGGVVPKGRAIMRSGARPGDSIFVTGSLGGAAGGLELLESGVHYAKARGRQRTLLGCQVLPTPQVEVGRYLSSRRLATAMIDVSDGLSSDLAHLCRESGVGAQITGLPVNPNLFGYLAEDDAMQKALHGGEDFELLFTSRGTVPGEVNKVPVTKIGRITSAANKIDLITDGEAIDLRPEGFRHF
jgi:thiamine-monophosphate kinase